MVFDFDAFYPISGTESGSPVDNMTEKTPERHLILASQSSVRARLLRDAGVAFETRPAFVDEASLIGEAGKKMPSEIAVELATAKARAVGKRDPQAIVIGGDQLLTVDGTVLQKPVDLEAAHRRLSLLSGRSHELVTAVVLVLDDRVVWQHVETARLFMHALSSDEIAAYLKEDGPEVLQSVGSYRLEGPGIRLFAKLEGDYFAMLGLPLVPLLAALRQKSSELISGAASK